MPRRNAVIWLLVATGLLSLCLSRAVEAIEKPSGDASVWLKDADRCRKALDRSQKRKKYRHNWLNCIHLYEKIYKTYPKSEQTPWALYQAGRLYTGLYTYSLRFKDLDEAIGLYRRLVDEYENHCLADDAQYLIGEAYYKYKKSSTQAYVEYLKVDIKFPSGDMRPRARKRMDELALVMSKKEEEKAGEIARSGKQELVAVNDIRHWSTPNYTRVVVDLERPVKYEHNLLKEDPAHKKPRRLYLDLKNAKVSSEIDRFVPIKDGLLQRARAGQYDADTVRVVLDMEDIGGYKVFHLYDPFRIVADIHRAEKATAENSVEPMASKRRPRRGIRKADAPDDSRSLARQLGLNVKKIVIDPGHGGKDPGCYLGKGIREKDIVLRLALKLAESIRKKIGCEVVLTRTKDVFLSLEKRTAIANMEKADLFISLHINAHRDKRIWGLETYFLNMATDERAVMVAARENATSEKSISDLQAILNDLMLNTKIHESNRLAHEVQEGMISNIGAAYKPLKSLGIKQAPFYVLIGAQMPAVLVEIGFLTNQMERKRLMSGKYQETVAAGITAGVDAYIESIENVYRGG